MGKKKIKVYTKFNKEEFCSDFFAIIHDGVIKYIDLDNNKMIVDTNKHVITRENSNYIFTMNFIDNIVNVYVKSMKQGFDKEIKTLLVEKSSKRYIVRYLLTDEKIVNEYYVDF